MTLVLTASEVTPYVCVVVTCDCGRRRVLHGAHAGELPTGWRELPGEEREPPRHLCEGCASEDAAAVAKRGPRAGRGL